MVSAYSAFNQLDALASGELADIAILIRRTLNPTWVPTSLCLQFQEGIYILDEDISGTRLWIALFLSVLIPRAP